LLEIDESQGFAGHRLFHGAVPVPVMSFPRFAATSM
jgi:hypothetical protein